MDVGWWGMDGASALGFDAGKASQINEYLVVYIINLIINTYIPYATFC